MFYPQFKVCIRRHLPVKQEAESLDGNIYHFRMGWLQTKDSYPGEIAYILQEYNSAIKWISSGDLEIQLTPGIKRNSFSPLGFPPGKLDMYRTDDNNWTWAYEQSWMDGRFDSANDVYHVYELLENGILEFSDYENICSAHENINLKIITQCGKPLQKTIVDYSIY